MKTEKIVRDCVWCIIDQNDDIPVAKWFIRDLMDDIEELEKELDFYQKSKILKKGRKK